MPEVTEQTKQLINAFKADRNYKKFAGIAAETPGMIEELIRLCYLTVYPFPQYSSWLLSHVAENHFKILEKYQHAIIDVFLDCTEPSTQRNLGNVLQRFPPSEHRDGELLDKLFQFLLNPETKVAMKVYAMYLIYGFSRQFPELQNELKTIIEDGLERESAAYHSAARKILKIFQNNSAT